MLKRASGNTYTIGGVPAFVVILLIVILTGIVGALGYAHWRIVALTDEVTLLENSLASTSAALATTTQELRETNTSLAQTLTTAEQSLENKVNEVRSQVGNVEQTVGQVSGSVNTLEKLTKTDPELLQKYSRVFFLNEHYAPEDVIEIPDQYKYIEERNYPIHTRVWPYLQNMLDAAARAGRELYVYSAYRPFEEQAALNEQYTITYGEGTANQFSANQGYSEHQLGTTVDLITTGIDGTLEGFEETDDFQWLQNNAHKYGFVLSYPEGNEYYVYEPWHWRFVGTELATDLHNTDRHFYDLQQREIDEYRANLFE